MAKAGTDTAAAEARRAYKREWARKNPDKVKAAQQRYPYRMGHRPKPTESGAGGAETDEK